MEINHNNAVSVVVVRFKPLMANLFLFMATLVNGKDAERGQSKGDTICLIMTKITGRHTYITLAEDGKKTKYPCVSGLSLKPINQDFLNRYNECESVTFDIKIDIKKSFWQKLRGYALRKVSLEIWKRD